MKSEPGNLRQESAFPTRNALDDHAAIVSDERFAGQLDSPFVTIAVPTFRRPEMLAEAVRSALRQDFDRPFEILVVDNDPDTDVERFIAGLPELAQANVRYLVNRENLGMFGNWNRCLSLARGEWITILNDDDLLDPDYLTRMFRVLDSEPKVDGIVCRKRILDEREQVPKQRGILSRVSARVWAEMRWRGKPSRRFPAHRFFWGNMIGNGAGFLFRTETGRQLGGYLPEEYPSADYFFFIRFAKWHRLHQHRAIACSVRIADNESAKRETLIGFMKCGYAVQQKMLGRDAYRWQRHLSPMMIARHRVEISEFWNQDIAEAEVERELGLKLTRDRPWLLWTIRAALGGY